MPSLLQRIRLSYQNQRRRSREKIQQPTSPVSVLNFQDQQPHHQTDGNVKDTVSEFQFPQDRLDLPNDVMTAVKEPVQQEEDNSDVEASPRNIPTTKSPTIHHQEEEVETIHYEGGEDDKSSIRSMEIHDEADPSNLANFHYSDPTKVPGKCESMIGTRVQVKSTIKDPKKKNQIGCVTQWMNKSTVEMKCDSGTIFRVRVTSINFLAPVVREMNDTHDDDAISGGTATTGTEGQHEINTNRSQYIHLEQKGMETTGIIDTVGDEDLKQELDKVQESSDVAHDIDTAQDPSTAMNIGEYSISDNSIPDMVEESASTTELMDHITQGAVSESHAAMQIQEESVTEPSERSYYKYPSQVPAHCETLLGKRVQVKDSIRDRKKRNAMGSIRRLKNKSTVEIKCDNGTTFGVKLTSLEFLVGNTTSPTSSHPESIRSSPPLKRTTKRLRSVGHAARSVLSAPKASSSPKNVKRTGRIRRGARSLLQPVSTVNSNESSSSTIDEGGSWQVPEAATNQFRFGGFSIEKLRLRSDSRKKQDTTFLNLLLNSRMLTVDAPFNGRKNQKSFERTTVDDSGYRHDLVSCKIYDDESGPAMQKTKLARLVYARTEGPGMEVVSMEEHLLRIGDFTTLNPRKIAARLELFQSPSGVDIVKLDPSDCADIPDRGYVGGGFIQENKLVEILEKAGMSPSQASRVDAIQVRLFIPSMGVYKGMLVKKRASAEAAASIELPWSMKKVMKSTHPNPLPGAYIVICKTGVHPSSGSANEYIGRKLDPSLKAPPEKSFKSKIKKPLSDMVFRLWQTMGVPKQLCAEYKKESLNTDRRNHAWLVGVPDPTNSLPPDTVFVPGMKTSGLSDIFVTRSPCYAYDHGRKFASITNKPDCMSFNDWNWLNNDLNFGVIIFSNPLPGMMSIPERIANGDLDGDLYLVCWDKIIVKSMNASPLIDKVSDDDGKLSTMPSNPTWYNDAQDIMVDAGLNNEIGFLTGKLYKLGEKYADDSNVGLKNTDANAFYKAYNQSLEFKKHGRPIALPSHLIGGIPAKLRHLVRPLDA